MVKTDWLEKVLISDFTFFFGLEILGLQSHLHSNTGNNLEIVNIEYSRIQKLIRFSCLYVIRKVVILIAEYAINISFALIIWHDSYYRINEVLFDSYKYFYVNTCEVPGTFQYAIYLQAGLEFVPSFRRNQDYYCLLVLVHHY